MLCESCARRRAKLLRLAHLAAERARQLLSVPIKQESKESKTDAPQD